MSRPTSALRAAVRCGVRAGARLGRGLPGVVGARARYLDLMGRMDAGHAPSDWEDDVRADLRRADDLLERGRSDEALVWFDKALRIAYHPSLHYGEAPSPLATAPEAFLAPFRASALGRALLEPPARDEGPHRPAPRERGEDVAVRLLVVAQRNWTFVEPVIEALSAQGFEIRRFEVDDLPPAQRPSREHVLRARLDLARTGARIPTPQPLLEQFAWADAVLVEWGHHVLTWFSMLEDQPLRTAARFHRFEVYTPFPLLTVFSAVDRVLFVSPHVRTLLDHLTANLSRARGVFEVDNFLAHGLGPEPDDSSDPYLLAQVGWVRPVKDVLFTLDLLERLRTRDHRYRLLLVGPGLPAEPADDTPFEKRVRARLEAMPAGAVEILGPRDDVPEVLAGAGWIVSSSLVEGVHEAVMEGLAAGCLPVIRDWPGALAYGGARVIYEDEWVVDDVAAGAERVRGIVESEHFAELSAACRAWVVRRRSPDVVAQRYVAALTPDDAR
jgi:glycosyltransferase involved in cell wall biosynthesis